MAFNGGLNSKIHLKDANLAMIYAFRLLREQSIASSSFVEVTPHCPLLLCLVGDRSVRRRATAPSCCRCCSSSASSLTSFAGVASSHHVIKAPLLLVIHRSFSSASSPAGSSLPLPGGPCRRSSSSPQPHHPLVHCCCWPYAPSHHPPPRLIAWPDSSLVGAAVREPLRADLHRLIAFAPRAAACELELCRARSSSLEPLLLAGAPFTSQDLFLSLLAAPLSLCMRVEDEEIGFKPPFFVR
ncbi:hypothetical protein Scep_026454 [Stephania cephalantha]|uniref:Uncharacterized protein n=1 Tax=Stephania cephalantha TaxID=152367 RepID=A0AAP0EMR2_9MAGN